MRIFKLLIVLLLLAAPLAFVHYDSSQHKKMIRIATGGVNGGYYAFAQKYKELLQKDGVNLEIVTTDGSIDAQKRLLSDEVDYAFVQGGTEITGEGLFALANIAYEPIWVFYYDSNITTLSDLQSRRIAVGKVGSGIYPVAKDLLNESGINEENSDLLHLSNVDAAFELQSRSIDAMFYVAAPNAKLIKKLLSNSEIRLLDFKNATTYKQYFLKKNEDYQILKLEASALDLKEKIPTTPHTLLAKNALIATLHGTDAMTRLMMKTLAKVHSSVGMFHKEKTFPNASMLAFEQHNASVEYFREPDYFYEEHFDFWTAQSLKKLQNFALIYLFPILLIFLFFKEVIVPIFDWIKRRKITVWYKKINHLDRGIELLTLSEAKDRKIMLEHMLQDVRKQDNISAAHMEEFYTLQNQISNILNDVQKRIEELK